MRRNPAAFPTPQTTGCALAYRFCGANTTTTLQTSPARRPPPWGRAGVGAAKKRAATKPHRTSSFTYTFPATLYVKTTIGYALAHRLPSDTTIAASPRPRRSIGVVAEAANAKKQTSAHKQHLHPPSPSFSSFGRAVPVPRCGLRPAVNCVSPTRRSGKPNPVVMRFVARIPPSL